MTDSKDMMIAKLLIDKDLANKTCKRLHEQLDELYHLEDSLPILLETLQEIANHNGTDNARMAMVFRHKAQQALEEFENAKLSKAD